MWGILGRDKASIAGYKYSEPLRALSGKWTYDDLNSFLKSPKGVAPGTTMRMKGIASASDRAAILAYFRTLADELYPLP